ncbi:hypothetical protein M413DRAFT_29865 [Hebeloma cylindrosporum]|uniref:Peptidase S1 domain-containing protein n=1 Tax=Hebeloma cylindrosporum TaxID=76867 RepID=A0A0C2XMK6_HEBCY|nr:hypothetical protein M413DRAFT_29865 [Hebeloma cylindrosporum h7]
MVLKNGNTSKLTVGRLNTIRSLVRYYFDGNPGEISKEIAVLPRNSKSGPFSAPGDSGSVVVDGVGRICGILTGGDGATDVSDCTFLTSINFLAMRSRHLDFVLPIHSFPRPYFTQALAAALASFMTSFTLSRICLSIVPPNALPTADLDAATNVSPSSFVITPTTNGNLPSSKSVNGPSHAINMTLAVFQREREIYRLIWGDHSPERTMNPERTHLPWQRLSLDFSPLESLRFECSTMLLVAVSSDEGNE